MTHVSNFWAIVPAAGVGKRVGGDIPKQYQKLGNQPVITQTLSRLAQVKAIQKIIVCTAPDDPWWPTLKLSTKVLRVDGGAERYHSVLNGLQALREFAAPEDWVLVHDAARPCVRTEDIQRLLDIGTISTVGGLLATPVRDTMKRGKTNNEVETTVSRENLWHALTPQMFRLAPLINALENIVNEGQTVTDEAQAMELAGMKPLLVEGNADNIKITWPHDLALAEWYLQQQNQQ